MAVLDVRGVEVSFGGLAALSGVDLSAEAGCVTGLIGPNGAGKTTAFNVICGLQRPTAGTVHLGGRDVTALAAHRRARLGVARTFQRLEVFGSLSVFDNVLVAAEIRRRWSRERFRPRSEAEEIVELVGLKTVADEMVGILPTGTARLVELARALATRPSLLLLDEPSAGLDDCESDALGALLVRLASRGIAVLLVEHDVDLVMSVCATVHVLDFGRVLRVGTPDEVRADPDVKAAYLGASVGEAAGAPA